MKQANILFYAILIFTFLINEMLFSQPGSYSNGYQVSVYNPFVRCEKDSIYGIEIDTSRSNPIYHFKIHNSTPCWSKVQATTSCFINPVFRFIKKTHSSGSVDTMDIIFNNSHAQNGKKLNYTPMDQDYRVHIPFMKGIFEFCPDIFIPKYEKALPNRKLMRSFEKLELDSIFKYYPYLTNHNKHYNCDSVLLSKYIFLNEKDLFRSYSWASKEKLLNTKDTESLYLFKDSVYLYTRVCPNLDSSTEFSSFGKWTIKDNILTLNSSLLCHPTIQTQLFFENEKWQISRKKLKPKIYSSDPACSKNVLLLSK